MAQQAAPSTVATPVPDHDFMPLNGIHHVELYVGNALQAAYFYAHAFGFQRVAYRGLETGTRDQVSHVLQQGRIRLVLTGALHSGSPIAAHQHKHGDGVKVIALSVPERRPRLPRGHEPRRRERRRAARGLRRARHGHASPRSRPTARRCTPSSSAAATTGPFLPGFDAVEDGTEDSGMLLAIDHIVGNVELGAMETVGQVLRGRLRDDRDDPLLRRGHLDRVLGAHVQGRQRRQGPREVPDQRARRGQAQVADRRVPRVLRGRRAPSTSPWPRATSSAPSPRCAAAASSS